MNKWFGIANKLVAHRKMHLHHKNRKKKKEKIEKIKMEKGKIKESTDTA